MTTKAVSTKRFKLQIGDGAGSETFTTIAELTNVKGPSEKAAQLDATSFDSDAMEFIAGLSDNGEVTFDVNFVGSNAQQQQLRTDLRAGNKRNFKIIVNDHPTTPTTINFAAIVTQAPELSGSVNAVLKGSGALKVSGQATWSYAP
jgi:hypothetical protein